MRLNWEGRAKRKGGEGSPEAVGGETMFQIGGTTFSDDIETSNLPDPDQTKTVKVPRLHNPGGRLRSPEGSYDQVMRDASSLQSKAAPGPVQVAGISANYDRSHSPWSIGDRATSGASSTPYLRDQLSTTQLSRLRDTSASASPYPSPEDSFTDSPNGQNKSYASHMNNYQPPQSAQMLPPILSPSYMPPNFGNHRSQQDPLTMVDLHRKRMRFSSPFELRDIPRRHGERTHVPCPNEAEAYYMDSTPTTKSPFGPPQPPQRPPDDQYNAGFGSPMTPGTPFGTMDGISSQISTRDSPLAPVVAPDPRRLSVESLLSTPPANTGTSTFTLNEDSNSKSGWLPSHSDEDSIFYGIDRGFEDLDVPKNDDHRVLSTAIRTPSGNNLLLGFADTDSDSPAEFGFGLFGKNTTDDSGGYYSNPVPVTIPRSLDPLPPTLRDNSMNLLYFHHFLNHTARILTPHDCSGNPFKNILPQSKCRNQCCRSKHQHTNAPIVALKDPNLLHLLLAYSAGHRARLLNHPEPAIRIAMWVRDVFPNLRHALSDTTGQISNSMLATAIMLTSLEIVSPNTFEVPIPWQIHLSTARRMITARGGVEAVHRKDKVSYFLSRWFVYLDVLGSLSGGKNDRPLHNGDYWSEARSSRPSLPSPVSTATSSDSVTTNAHSNGGRPTTKSATSEESIAMCFPLEDAASEDEDDFQIDCLLGFTSRCVSILARIASLARKCDIARIDPVSLTIRPEWTPSTSTIAEAEFLKSQLKAARTHRYRGCPHRRPNNEIEDGWDALEMVATNEAFHWAGLVHLDRRILGKESKDDDVQTAVREIAGTLYKVRKGGTAEACLLWPMFTAGCEAPKEGAFRERILERLRSVEGCGMTQAYKARTLMEKVWETGKPWETLVQGEFFG